MSKSPETENPIVARLVDEFRVSSAEGAAKASVPFLELTRLMPEIVGHELSKVEMIRAAENIVQPASMTQEVAIDLARRNFILG